jgi:hypothetical protein
MSGRSGTAPRICGRCWADRQDGVPALGIPKVRGFHRSVRVVQPVVVSGSITQRRFD